MPCTLMSRRRIDILLAVELGLGRTCITDLVGIFQSRTRVCTAFSFAATELTPFLVTNSSMGNSGRSMSYF